MSINRVERGGGQDGDDWGGRVYVCVCRRVCACVLEVVSRRRGVGPRIRTKDSSHWRDMYRFAALLNGSPPPPAHTHRHTHKVHTHT